MDAKQPDAVMLAEGWFALAAAGDLRGLARALAVGKGRKDAARAVMQRSPERCRAFQQALVIGLRSHRPRTRFECAHALDSFGDASVRGALARLMDDPVPRVRWMAMHALSCHACGGKPAALEDGVREKIAAAALSDPSPKVRRHAVFALTL